MPEFNAKEIQHLFLTLGYPHTIRSDAITAVGAPSSIAFLMKAIYWLYLVVRTFYGRPEAIQEESEELKSETSFAKGEGSKSNSQRPSRAASQDSITR